MCSDFRMGAKRSSQDLGLWGNRRQTAAHSHPSRSLPSQDSFLTPDFPFSIPPKGGDQAKIGGKRWLTVIDRSVSAQFMRPYLSLLWIACVRRSPRGR